MDGVAIVQLRPTEIGNRDLLVGCLHLRPVDVVARIATHRDYHALRERVGKNRIVDGDDGHIGDGRVGKALEIRIKPFM